MRFGVLQAHRGHAIKWFSLGLIYLCDEIAEYIGHNEENIGNYSTITNIGKYREYRTTGLTQLLQTWVIADKMSGVLSHLSMSGWL